VEVFQVSQRGGAKNGNGLEAELNETFSTFSSKRWDYRPSMTKDIFDDDDDLVVKSISAGRDRYLA